MSISQGTVSSTFLKANLLYVLTFMSLGLKIRTRLIKQWKCFDPSYVEHSLIKWELSFHQYSITARCLGKSVGSRCV